MYRITQLPNKGKALVATRNISEGTVIICEKPTAYCDASDDIVRVLSPCVPPDFVGDTAEQKVLRNAFYYRTPKTKTLAVILPIGALMNHSCLPNVMFRPDDGNMEFVASRDITKGEELCDTYCDLRWSRKQRQKHLLENYKFTCKCPRCELVEIPTPETIDKLEKMRT